MYKEEEEEKNKRDIVLTGYLLSLWQEGEPWRHAVRDRETRRKSAGRLDTKKKKQPIKSRVCDVILFRYGKRLVLVFLFFMASVRDIRSHLYVMRSDSFFFLCLWCRTKRRRRKKRGELAMRIGDDPVVSGSYWQCKTKNCGQGSVRPFHISTPIVSYPLFLAMTAGECRSIDFSPALIFTPSTKELRIFTLCWGILTEKCSLSSVLNLLQL